MTFYYAIACDDPLDQGVGFLGGNLAGGHGAAADDCEHSREQLGNERRLAIAGGCELVA
jgi:hypothetical protein